jgi:hypothetical protein
MTHWIGSGEVAWCIAGLMVLEMLALGFARRLRAFLPTILAGAFLLLAWGLSGHWPLAALCLLASLIAHGTDLKVRGAF